MVWLLRFRRQAIVLQGLDDSLDAFSRQVFHVQMILFLQVFVRRRVISFGALLGAPLLSKS